MIEKEREKRKCLIKLDIRTSTGMRCENETRTFLIIYDLSETFFDKRKKIAMKKTCQCKSEKKGKRTMDSSTDTCVL